MAVKKAMMMDGSLEVKTLGRLVGDGWLRDHGDY